jgi:hypothetical protein
MISYNKVLGHTALPYILIFLYRIKVIDMFNSNLCEICDDCITDPVCKKCYINQTMILLNDLKINSIAINFINDKLKNAYKLETLNDIECILCKKDIVTMCRYCFSAILIRILEELNFSDDLIENFEYNPGYEELENLSILNYEMRMK